MLLLFSQTNSGIAAMTTRSKLLFRILRGWDQSLEAQLYLGWLIDAESSVDTGDILREAVLEIAEQGEAAPKAIGEKMEEFLSQLPHDVADTVRKETEGLVSNIHSMHASLRSRATGISELRKRLGLGRLETLALIAQLQHESGGDSEKLSAAEVVAVVTNFAKIAEGANYEECEALAREHLPPGIDLARIIDALMEHSAQTTSLSRTTLDGSTYVRPGKHVNTQDASKSEEPEPTNTVEDLDHYYAYEIVARLEQIVERASALEPVELKVTNEPVKRLFREAHEAYIYGFDVACIALCGSLIEHALKDKLPGFPNEYRDLGALIERAQREKLLTGPELDAVRRVARDRNKVMHDVTNLRSTSEDLLTCTRIVLNRLYRSNSSSAVSS